MANIILVHESVNKIIYLELKHLLPWDTTEVYPRLPSYQIHVFIMYRSPYCTKKNNFMSENQVSILIFRSLHWNGLSAWNVALLCVKFITPIQGMYDNNN